MREITSFSKLKVPAIKHGIHVSDDKLFLRIDICFYLWEHIQIHTITHEKINCV